MKCIIYTLLLLLCTQYIHAQPPTMQQKLYYTCKAWGFAKYYHSNVSVCNVNWDSVLLATLPNVRTATTYTEFNDALLHMLTAAGPMAISTSYFPDTLPTELKRNRDWSWLSSPILRPDVRIILDTIKNNFRPHPGCWVDYSSASATGPYSYLTFGADSIMLRLSTVTTFPAQDQRLLMFYKYWNIIKYFNPYNYVTDVSWDTVLYNYCVPISTVATAEPLFLLYEKISAALDDAHVDGLTYSSTFQSLPGFYMPKLQLRYFEGKYVVVKSGISGIVRGDALVTIDGKTATQWEDSLRQYCSIGNPSVFRRQMSNTFLGRKVNGTSINLVVEDNTATNNTFNVSCVWPPGDPTFFYDDFYTVDSLSTIHWKTLNCDIGYVNMANLAIGEENSMYSELLDKSAIIFDLRNGSLGTAWNIAELLFPGSTQVAKYKIPDINYPGTFFWFHQYIGVPNPSFYTGKVILLMDENTQSHGEWSCMVLGATGNVIKVGNQTAAADGDISSVKLSNDLSTGFTSLGVYYPNGDSTQRIGIVPDTVVTQTRQKLRQNRDNVLEKALTIAGCDAFLSTPSISSHTATIVPYPNPCSHALHLNLSGITPQPLTITITDLTGRQVLTNYLPASSTIIHTDTHMLSPGMYFISITGSDINLVSKFVKK